MFPRQFIIILYESLYYMELILNDFIIRLIGSNNLLIIDEFDLTKGD